MGDKRKVFISHSSLDKEKINKLASSLKSLGCDIFYSSDITTNKLKFGTSEGGIYGQIKKEISKSGVVLFMVSENFYSSIPSMIEIGIAYTLEKEMVPIAFKSGNYKEDLKAIFNYNQLLPSLDNDEDVIKLLTQISNSNAPVEIFKYQKEILEDIRLKNSVECNEVDEELDTIKDTIYPVPIKELATDIDDELVLSVVAKMNRLSGFDYIFIKYICEDRVSRFKFDTTYEHWSYDFKKWKNKVHITSPLIDVEDEKFLRLLDRYGLLDSNQFYSDITPLGLSVIEYIYDRSYDIINTLMMEYTDIPF